MKRIQIRPCKFVTVSAALAEKAERVFASTAMSREETERIAKLEPRGATVFAGVVASRKQRHRKISSR
jgi:hypothetical protein